MATIVTPLGPARKMIHIDHADLNPREARLLDTDPNTGHIARWSEASDEPMTRRVMGNFLKTAHTHLFIVVRITEHGGTRFQAFQGDDKHHVFRRLLRAAEQCT